MKEDGLPELIKRKMQELGIGLLELAQRLNVTRQTVDRWKKGTVQPKESMILRIKALKSGVTLSVTESEVVVHIPRYADPPPDEFEAQIGHVTVMCTFGKRA